MLKKTLLLTLSLLTLFLASASAQTLSLKENDTVSDRFAANPRAVRDIGDPHVIKANDEYFAFATGGPIGFNVWRSADLNTFAKEKALRKIEWVSGDYWAPEVYAIDGRYYMSFTGRAKSSGGLRVGIAVSDQPQGPYEDAIGGPLFDFGYAVIDGTIFFDEAGTPYMIYSRDCSENMVEDRRESHLYGIQLAQDLRSVVGEPVLLTQPDVDWELISGDTRWNEGPTVIRHDGHYYLFYSANYFATKEYTVGVAVADHPLGPYTKQANNPILNYVEQDGEVIVSGPGHNSLFTVGDELFTSYHTHSYPLAPSGNRQLSIDRVGFHADGTAYINGPTLAAQLRPFADLGLVNHMTAATCDAQTALLTDGDICHSASSAAYVYSSSEAAFTWDTPVCADMLMIYPALGASFSGQVTINDSLTADFSFTADAKKPGGFAQLTFEPIEITSLKIASDCETGLGEVLLIGAQQ